MKHSIYTVRLLLAGLLATSLLPMTPAAAAASDKADAIVIAAAKDRATDTADRNGAEKSAAAKDAPDRGTGGLDTLPTLKERLAALRAKAQVGEDGDVETIPDSTGIREVKDRKTVSEETADEEEPAKKDEKAKTKKEKKQRFQEILRDESYTYYLDTQSARWIPMPKSGGEKILDVWIRLVDRGIGEATEEGAGDGEGTSPAKYFLEHYYIRPEKQQIQFLSELEVTGRPQNTINERAYSAQNWESLVPESVEDAIYHAVLDRMKKKNRTGSILPDGMSVRDGLEEFLHISI